MTFIKIYYGNCVHESNVASWCIYNPLQRNFPNELVNLGNHYQNYLLRNTELINAAFDAEHYICYKKSKINISVIYLFTLEETVNMVINIIFHISNFVTS